MATVIKRNVDDGENVFLEGILWKGVNASQTYAWSSDAPLQLYFRTPPPIAGRRRRRISIKACSANGHRSPG
ncbi:hypothetical protein [Rhizobium sp. G21]|uniref:hypothetical protein n=1 Tax=Rhizobium sp. G21 TaxID=2758439 RepID=UPI0016041344|nr:hypothetical protein [Rhizobium sp. G21]MBB1248389.1 hypothetical protein [Rhizobium sp. G21]